MKVVVQASLLLAAVLAGCAGESANPNLLAPKVILAARPDGNVTVYVHSAFGERDYDWIRLAVDNETASERSSAYALEHQVPTAGFFLDVGAGANGESFSVRARVDVDHGRDRARLSFLQAGGWSQPRTVNLPYETLLDRQGDSR